MNDDQPFLTDEELALQAQGRRVDLGATGKPGPAASLVLQLQGGLAHGQPALALVPQGGPTSLEVNVPCAS